MAQVMQRVVVLEVQELLQFQQTQIRKHLHFLTTELIAIFISSMVVLAELLDPAELLVLAEAVAQHRSLQSTVKLHLLQVVQEVAQAVLVLVRKPGMEPLPLVVLHPAVQVSLVVRVAIQMAVEAVAVAAAGSVAQLERLPDQMAGSAKQLVDLPVQTLFQIPQHLQLILV
jgi:hypothetical protein